MSVDRVCVTRREWDDAVNCAIHGKNGKAVPGSAMRALQWAAGSGRRVGHRVQCVDYLTGDPLGDGRIIAVTTIDQMSVYTLNPDLEEHDHD